MKVFKNKVSCLWITLGCFLPISLSSQSIATFEETLGLVVIEVESATMHSGWEAEEAITGYSGDNYLHYRGQNYFNNPGNALITYNVAIENPGKYRFQWRSRIAEGTSNTEHNDSWLRFNDASDFYGEKAGRKVYPKGTGKTPNPNGTSADGWMKIYQNIRNDWTWQTRTSDHDPHDIFVEFNTVGIYIIEISGRSKGHAIDRMVLFHSSVSSEVALNLANPESERLQNVGTYQVAPTVDLKVRPTLATNFIHFDIPKIKSGQYNVTVISLAGNQSNLFSYHLSQNSRILTLPVDQLLAGHHLVRFEAGEIQYQGRFIKQ